MKTYRLRQSKQKIVCLWVILALVLPFLLPNQRVYACSCTPPELDVALGAATAVFSGKVTNVIPESKQTAFDRNYPFIHRYLSLNAMIKIKFETIEVWKGLPYQDIFINTPMAFDCNLGELPIGSEFLVYAYGEQEHLLSHFCTGTRPLANANNDLAVLGAGNAPTLAGANEPLPPSNLGWLLVLCTAVILLVATTFFLIKRRRQPIALMDD